MSKSEIDRFAADLKANPALQEAAKQHFSNPLAQAVAFANANGYSFTVEHARSHVIAQAKTGDRPISDAELDKVAGGGCLASIANTIYSGLESAVQTTTNTIASGITTASGAVTSAANTVANTVSSTANTVAGAVASRLGPI
jgi:predicted ribosomally synthesized peptide with nif11-like leader